MPQMKPMNWFNLFILNLMMFLLLIMINYFNPINKKINGHKNWKLSNLYQTNTW